MALMTKKILVLKGDSYKAVGEMFARHGYEVLYGVENLSQADVVVFTGGSDVSPYIYGEEPHGARGCDPIRDEFEKGIFNEYPTSKVKIGICRGGQLLNVLNGGRMFQDLGLITGIVPVFDTENGYIDVLVDHHQGMESNPPEALGWGACAWHELRSDLYWPDYAIFYPKTKSFCFQPHPEWGHKGTEDYFFELLERHEVLNDSGT
jgi:GMP synthase-like glutamine amidotransferase